MKPIGHLTYAVSNYGLQPGPFQVCQTTVVLSISVLPDTANSRHECSDSLSSILSRTDSETTVINVVIPSIIKFFESPYFTQNW